MVSRAALAATATVGVAILVGEYFRRRRRGSPEPKVPAKLRDSVAQWHAVSDESVVMPKSLRKNCDPSPAHFLTSIVSMPELDLKGLSDMATPAFAALLDATDPLRKFRADFHIPTATPTYLCGNSLGLMPKATSAAVNAELAKWAACGVEGHFTGALPWATCEEALPALMVDLVGAADSSLEVAAMNSLTVNIHLLMAAFYRPKKGRAAILMEAGAFPSDRCAMVSQIQHHGFDPAVELIEIQPSKDGLLHADAVCAAIEANWERLACIMIGGVNYLTGQVLDMPAIAATVRARNAAAEARGAPTVPLGLDLAHAVGNVPLQLHEWGVDFAAWCTYKYLNAGAGCLAAIFVHEKHADDADVHPRLTGWWGVPFGERFKMAPGAALARGAAGFGCSNVNPLMVACLQQNLLVLQKAGGVRATRKKSLLLTGYLELLLKLRGLIATGADDAQAVRAAAAAAAAAAPRRCGVELATPSDWTQRGCQLSLRVVAADAASAPPSMRELERQLREHGVSTDAREPDIVRVSPAPLYNSFADALAFVEALEQCLVAMV